MTHAFLVVLTSIVVVSALPAAQSQDCKDWQACRQLALGAAERGDYDVFHDLAWRAVNQGPRNDPSLMTLLARAQALSGRPLDSLVMLNRLAALGVVTDAATSDDFRSVRALPAWSDLEARLAGKPVSPGASAEPIRPVAAPAPVKEPLKEPVKPETVEPPAPTSATPAATRGEKPAAKPGSGRLKPERGPAKPAEPAPLVFPASSVPSTVGLAYDAVSGRFIIGDRQERRLLVLGERSGRLSSLAGVDAGFHDIGALEIDAPEGDLWVVSTSAAGVSAVHKLQLISGRVLFSVELPADGDPRGARFSDVAVTPQSVLILDSVGRRVFRLAKKGKTLDLAGRIPAPEMTSLAPGPEGVAYAAYDQGIVRIDLSARSVTVVEPGQKVDLSGLTWMRWFRGSLIAIQRAGTDAYRLVRIRLDDGGRVARSLDPIEGAGSVAGGTSATLVGATLHYLNRNGGDQVGVAKLALK